MGIELNLDGVLVVGLSPAGNEAGSPAGQAGILPGDRIVALSGQAVHGGADLAQAVERLSGDGVAITVERGGEMIQYTVTPSCDANGAYQLGLWLREDVTGIGTVTFWDPATGVYGALGHGVSVSEGGAALLPIRGGALSSAVVRSVVPGVRGTPGELRGEFDPGQILGAVTSNTICGIYGTAACALSGAGAIPAARADEIALGPATILATVDAAGPREFTARIDRITLGGNDARELTVTVTDQALLRRTGGIVQGMSGAPILQNGRLVGAVTHVLVNDPATGYGISIEKMLAAAGSAARAA